MVFIFVTCSGFRLCNGEVRLLQTLSGEIFEHILYKAFNNRMIDRSTIFIDALISKPVQSRKVPEETGRKNGGGKREVGQEALYDDKDNDRPD